MGFVPSDASGLARCEFPSSGVGFSQPSWRDHSNWDLSTLTRVHFVNRARARATRVHLCTSGVRFVNRARTTATKLTKCTLSAAAQPTHLPTQRS